MVSLSLYIYIYICIGTVGEYNKFHDDKTTYTGAHKDT